MRRLRIGSWQELPTEGGSAAAFHGDWLAVGGMARLLVWQGLTRVASVDAPWPAPGVPRFVGHERVCWGAGWLELASGRYTAIESARPRVMPMGGEFVLAYAWSPRGDVLLGSFGTAERRRVALFDGRDGTLQATPVDELGLPAPAVWLGEHAAVIGLPDPLVFDRRGGRIATISLGGGQIGPISASADEQRILITDINRCLALVDSASWRIVTRWEGRWATGALSPDGRIAVALEPWGKLHLACVSRDRIEPAAAIPVDDAAVAVALDDERVATVSSSTVRWASLERESG